MLRIRFILIWIRIRIRPKIEKNTNICFTFFYEKNIFLQNLICFVIYGVNIYVSKLNFNRVEKKMNIIQMIKFDFFGNFQ